MRQLLLRASGGISRVSVFLGYACSVLYAACIVISVYEVVMRYGFGTPTAWSFELVMALCATAWILSSGYVTQQNRHIAVTMLELLVPPRVWRYFQLAGLLVSLFALSALAWAAWEPAHQSLAFLERSGSAFNPPLPAYLKVLLVFGALLYVLQLLANIVLWFNDDKAE